MWIFYVKFFFKSPLCSYINLYFLQFHIYPNLHFRDILMTYKTFWIRKIFFCWIILFCFRLCFLFFAFSLLIIWTSLFLSNNYYPVNGHSVLSILTIWVLLAMKIPFIISGNTVMPMRAWIPRLFLSTGNQDWSWALETKISPEHWKPRLVLSTGNQD